jgi:hypothetical protein
MGSSQEEFRFAYVHGSLECRIHVRTEDGRATTSFMTCEPGPESDAQARAHMALSIAQPKLDWMAEATTLADSLLSDVFAHAGARPLKPTGDDHQRLHGALSKWLHAVREERTRVTQLQAF